ncbi:MAG: hypothetical protein GY898_31340 [Proteobacteria bacterium]|nr:hypothetical protein [Pseudomonadota bacterium]
MPNAARGAIAAELGLTARTVSVLAGETPEPVLVRAVDGQLRLRSAWKAYQRVQVA